MQISTISRVGSAYIITMAHGGTFTISKDEKDELDKFGEEHEKDKEQHEKLKPLLDIFKETSDKEELKTKVSEFIDKM